MKNKIIKLKSIFVFVFFLIFIKLGYSQAEFKRSYEISLTNLPLQDFTFIFTQKIDDKNYLEITNSFVIHKSKEYDTGFLYIGDPYKLYDLYRFRIGNRHFRKNNNYICPMLIFSYGRWNNSTLKDDWEIVGEDHGVISKLDRTRYEIGTIIKFGQIKTYENRFIRDVYFGFGCKLKYIKDDILSIEGDILNDPIHEEYMRLMPTIHFGILVGYIK
jgi:hypothetical protein